MVLHSNTWPSSLFISGIWVLCTDEFDNLVNRLLLNVLIAQIAHVGEATLWELLIRHVIWFSKPQFRAYAHISNLAHIVLPNLSYDQ